MRGATLCVSHNPDAADLKRAAVKKGGQNRRLVKRAVSPARAVEVRTIYDVRDLLFRTLEEVRNGILDVDLGRTIGYLAGVTAKVVETADIENRVGELEKTVLAITSEESDR